MNYSCRKKSLVLVDFALGECGANVEDKALHRQAFRYGLYVSNPSHLRNPPFVSVIYLPRLIYSGHYTYIIYESGGHNNA
jgi:hypothetical protein